MGDERETLEAKYGATHHADAVQNSAQKALRRIGEWTAQDAKQAKSYTYEEFFPEEDDKDAEDNQRVV
jgi:hypothetical protein